MEIRILLDISEKFEKALRRIAYAIAAQGVIAKAQNQDVPAEEAPTADAPKTDDAPTADAPKTGDAPKKRAKAKKQAAPAVEISTPAAIAEGGKDGDGIAESNNEAAPEVAQENEDKVVEVTGRIISTEHVQAQPATSRRLVSEEAPAPEVAPQENEDELGKGAVGEIISELTGRLINRMNEEARDKATINRNLRAKCEELQLKFPTVPALIQAIGYGNAYKACIGEG